MGDRNDRCRLLLNLSPGGLPVARAHFRVGSTEAGLATYDGILNAARKGSDGLATVDDVVRPYIIAEIKEAIADSIARRPN